MSSQVRRFLQEFFGGCAAFHEMLERAFRRTEPVRRLQRVRSLDLIGAVRHHSQNTRIDLGDVAVRRSRSFHHVLGDHTANVIFRRRDVLRAFRDGPFVRSSFEVPLRFG